jgi:glycerate 2-kinase
MTQKNKTPAELYAAALKAVLPYELVKDRCRYIEALYEEGNFSRLNVVGFGKAACPMEKAIEDNITIPVDAGIVITKYGHCFETTHKIKTIEAGHPLPDENGLHGTQAILRMLDKADEHTMVVCLISGGGSALLVSPSEGISLEEKIKVTELLLRAGADIYDLNTVRKHISKVKGGRLAEIAFPSKIISLVLSDVIGDRLDVIASGPTVPDTTTYEDAFRVLEIFGLLKKAPVNVIDVLRRGAEGLLRDTPEMDSIVFKDIENIIIGNNKKALEAARTRAIELNLPAEIISTEITGEAREVGRWLAKVALDIQNVARTSHGKRVCVISGGETTVSVRGSGLGGRNTELALSFAIDVEGIDGLTLLSAGTDGTDGPTDAAGAIVDGQTIKRAKNIDLEAEKYLENNDSYNFFRQTGELFLTGPTGTNVMDIQIIVIE